MTATRVSCVAGVVLGFGAFRPALAQRSGGDDLRETQRYVYDHGVAELDTLEVSAATLALRHIGERSTHTRNVLDVVNGRLRGTVTPTDTTVASVDIVAPIAFHEMMLSRADPAVEHAPDLRRPCLRLALIARSGQRHPSFDGYGAPVQTHCRALQ